MRDCIDSLKFLKGGPRHLIFYDPKDVKAAVITCGGLCPGLNVVIREIVMSLNFNYEVLEVWGITWGYKGVYTNVAKNWVKLTPQSVKNMYNFIFSPLSIHNRHKLGGTILGSSRGGFDADKMLDSLTSRGIN